MAATPQNESLSYLEKTGYAMGDAAANLVWRGALAYLAVFYTDTFGLAAGAAALLILVVRLSDGITDILMGLVADRTNTKWGKFRPWILWSAPVLGLFMVLCFTTPDLGPNGKLIWAYVTYIGLTLAYTVNNVPYSALMGVMTPNHEQRAILSGYRFAGAFLGGALVMGFTPQLVELLGKGNDQIGYQYTMYLFAALLVFMCIITFSTTKERIQPQASPTGSLRQDLADMAKNLPFIIVPLLSLTLLFYYRNLAALSFFLLVAAGVFFAIRSLLNKPESNLSHTQKDFIDLLTNKPWLILLGVGFLFMMFNGVRFGVIAYYFKHFLHEEALTGWFFLATLGVSFCAALASGYLAKIFGKKKLFIASMVLGALFTSSLYFMKADQLVAIFAIGCIAEIFAAIMPVVYFSMLADTADYSEWKNKRRATGLIFSAGTFIQKTGGGFAGALVLIVLASYGYIGTDESTISQTTEGMKNLISWIPALFAIAAALLLMLYPLSDQRMTEIEGELSHTRSNTLDDKAQDKKLEHTHDFSESKA